MNGRRGGAIAYGTRKGSRRRRRPSTGGRQVGDDEFYDFNCGGLLFLPLKYILNARDISCDKPTSL